MKCALLLLALSTAGCLRNYGHPLVNQRILGWHSWDRSTAQLEIDKLSDARKQSLAVLIAEALKDGDPCIRLNAASALGSIDQVALPFVPVLQEALADEDRMVRQEAGITLAKLGHPSGAPVIAELFAAVKGDEAFRKYRRFVTYWDLPYNARRDPHMSSRRRAINALWLIAEGRQHLELKGYTAALATALTDPAPEIREKAAQALSAMGPGAAPATAALIKTLTDPIQRPRVAAFHALRAIATREAFGAIADFDADRRTAADERAERMRQR